MHAAAKSVSKVPDFDGEHATCAVASTSKMLSVVCLDGMHLWDGMYKSHGVPLKALADRRDKNLAITITQG